MVKIKEEAQNQGNVSASISYVVYITVRQGRNEAGSVEKAMGERMDS
jgi:hypothetical protein